MTRKKKNKHGCPSVMQLELLCLDEGLAEDDRKRTQIHLQQCHTCREKVRELDEIYSIFIQEISKPVTNGVLDLAKSLSGAHVKYGMLMCEPQSDKTNGYGSAYFGNLVFAANGEVGKKKLADFDPKQYPKTNISLRLMTDPTQDKTILSLFTNTNDELGNWVLRIPAVTEEIRFNNAGIAVVSSVPLEKLDKKMLFFDLKPAEILEENRFERILKALL